MLSPNPNVTFAIDAAGKLVTTVTNIVLH